MSVDTDTRNTFLALLRVLAARYVFGGSGDRVWFPTSLAAGHTFDFTNAGLAYLKPFGGTVDGAYTLMEPLAVELCAHLFLEVGFTPAAVEAWQLLLQSNLQQTGATVSEGFARSVTHAVCLCSFTNLRFAIGVAEPHF